MHPRILALALLLSLAAASCTGSKDAPAPRSPANQATAGVTETRWLRGLWATDVSRALREVNMPCTGPTLENRESVWACESGTPLVSYKTRFYGSAPGKIEYITATVTQSDRPKDDLALRVFIALAGLHFEGADPQKARAWVREHVGAGGTVEFGPARFKLMGDARKRQFDITARGSDW